MGRRRSDGFDATELSVVRTRRGEGRQDARSWRIGREIWLLPAQVDRALQPARGLRVEIVVVGDAASVEEALADVADRALDLALRLRPVRPAGAGHEPPVPGEAQELRVQHQAAAGRAIVGEHDGAHLVEQQLLANDPRRGTLTRRQHPCCRRRTSTSC